MGILRRKCLGSFNHVVGEGLSMAVTRAYSGVRCGFKSRFSPILLCDLSQVTSPRFVFLIGRMKIKTGPSSQGCLVLNDVLYEYWMNTLNTVCLGQFRPQQIGCSTL